MCLILTNLVWYVVPDLEGLLDLRSLHVQPSTVIHFHEVHAAIMDSVVIGKQTSRKLRPCRHALEWQDGHGEERRCLEL